MPEYIPTPEEIVAARDAIRDSWTPAERRRRWCYKPHPLIHAFTSRSLWEYVSLVSHENRLGSPEGLDCGG